MQSRNLVYQRLKNGYGCLGQYQLSFIQLKHCRIEEDIKTIVDKQMNALRLLLGQFLRKTLDVIFLAHITPSQLQQTVFQVMDSQHTEG